MFDSTTPTSKANLAPKRAKFCVSKAVYLSMTHKHSDTVGELKQPDEQQGLQIVFRRQ